MRAVLALALVGIAVWGQGVRGLAQVVGDEAEMERLERRAEDAIANGDAEGAAMNMGRAALMASQLVRREEDSGRARLLRGTERLFRGEEQAYRALALFERAGGRLPASSGVCGTIRSAYHHVAESVKLLEGDTPNRSSAAPAEQDRLQALADDWVITIESLRADFQCGE